MSITASPDAWPVGRTRRYAEGCQKIRSVRVDKATELGLTALTTMFAGTTPSDTVNPSILFRRSLHIYYRHVSTLLGNPHALAEERLQLIRNTHLPRRSRNEELQVEGSTQSPPQHPRF